MASERIHIVEDSVAISMYLRKLLGREGYCVTGVSQKGEEALNEVRYLLPDMVLMDVNLAGHMTGTEVAGLIKDEFNIPVIYVTGSTDATTIQKAKLTEPYGYVFKPFNDREILTSVEMCLHKASQEKRRKKEAAEQCLRNKELAELKKQLAELRIEALQSVMNPHFIFNALNSIQYFIANQDRVSAMKYFSTFSKLIRCILDSANKNRITLKEELEMLRHYADLELLRFEHKFNFVIKIEEGLDVENIEIPPLLIQPYLENAILHGLPSNLEICITEQQGALHFKIEDDGVRNDSTYKLIEHLPRPDTGLVSEERLRLMSQCAKIKVQATDLASIEKGKTGTRVLISMPLKVKVES